MSDDANLEECWDLSPLYEDGGAFARARECMEQETLPALERWRGRLGESAATLAAALDAFAEASKELRRLHSYASLGADSDVRLPAAQALRQEVELLGTDLARRIAFAEPEILALPEQTVLRFLAAEPRLASHAHPLRDLLRRRAHVRGPAEEQIIAETGRLTRDAAALYQVLVHAELPRPTMTLAAGETVRLTPVEFHRLRSGSHRADRLALFPAYFGAHAAFRETLGQNLHAALKSHVFRARVRGYPSCLAAALDADNVPVELYHRLIAQVRAHLPLLQRYLALRACALGLAHLEYPDLYCPLGTEPPRRFTSADARALIARGLAPLGDDYVAALTHAFRSRWLDWHPTPGKRSGAYATGWAYDVHPYVLLNFNGDYESVLTVAHELGHALHSHYSNATQPFPTADYSIFVAEVASTFNEALVLRPMLEAASTREQRVFLLGSYLDGLRGTLFRQTMFAEFELAIHERAERGEALTGEKLDAAYLELLRAYHGHDRGVMHVADAYAVEWAAVPHLYYDFYVYQYATGIVAASSLAQDVLEGGAPARRRYLDFLASGGSAYPLELLRAAGVDLASSGPYEATFAAFERMLHELERELAHPAA